jgi:hypothetical protein
VGPLRVWDAATGRELLPFHFTAPVDCAALSPDGRYLLTGSWFGPDNVFLWEVATGQKKLSFPVPGSFVSAVAFSPDGRRLVTGTPGGAVSLWEAATGREILTFQAGDARINDSAAGIHALAFSGDGRRLFTLFSGSSGSTVRVWEAASERQIAAWQKEERETRERLRQLEQQESADWGYWAMTVTDSLERAAKRDEAAGQPELARKERQRVGDIMRDEQARKPPSADALNVLAWFCAKHDLFLPEALQAAQRAVALSPNNTNILDTLAELHFRMGHRDQAIAIETRALAMEPMGQDFKDHLARFRIGKQQTRGETNAR